MNFMLTLKPRRDVAMVVEVGKDQSFHILFSNVTNEDMVRTAEKIGREGHLWVSEREPTKHEYWPPGSIRRITWDFDESN